jgi:8-oxo-dGTP pyrophosphatase MutT (NUDIX family)
VSDESSTDLEREDAPVHRWRDREERRILETKIFDVVERDYVEDETGKQGRFVRIDSPDWVNIVALTADAKVVLIEQFRHGIDEITLEVAGGMVDPGETPLDAARRELREETGYVAERWTEIGWVHPNPAIQGNTMTTFLAEGATRAERPEFDRNERCRVVLAEWDHGLRLVDERRITHALVVNALFFARRHLDRR